MSALAELTCDTCIGNCRCTDQPKPETCAQKGCIEADEDLYRCEECNQRFCRSHVKAGDCFHLCLGCSAREQEIQGTSMRLLELQVLQKQRAGKFLTNDDFLAALMAFAEGL